MGKKFVLIGAGSYVFTRNLVRDILTFPAFQDATIALVDINPENLENARQAVERIIEAGRYPAKVIATTDRAEALPGADGVLSMLMAQPLEVFKNDLLICERYGVKTCVGDTRGAAGIFRFLRTVPVMLDILSDLKRYCPNAIFLNYTNPMAMLCRAMQEAAPEVTITGLCHSVQGGIHKFAQILGVPAEEITYLCAGINHMAYYLKLEHNGRDLYPELRRRTLEDKEVYESDIVRNEVFLALGYYVTESSGHNSEYNQWFRKRPDLIEKYCTHGTGWNPGHYAYSLEGRKERRKNPMKQYDDWMKSEFSTKKSQEYAADIFNARIGDGKPFIFNGNVINNGSIPNLPADACVEVPVVADRMGFKTTIAGPLPDHLAILVNTTARIESLVVEAAMHRSKEMVYHAVYMDPLTSAVCSLDEIKRLCDELFEAEAPFFIGYK